MLPKLEICRSLTLISFQQSRCLLFAQFYLNFLSRFQLILAVHYKQIHLMLCEISFQGDGSLYSWLDI